MKHEDILKGLVQLGFNTGWVVSGDDYENIIWENDSEKPTEKAVQDAALQADVARAEAKAEVIAKLGLTADEVTALLS
jgi:hypothetical protein